MSNKVVLVILDGWGVGNVWGANAISQARTPTFDELWRDNPHSALLSSGKAVGLTGSEIGNSEVGHLTLGAGRIIFQDASRINQTIKNKEFFQNKTLVEVIHYAKYQRKSLHIMGLLSGAQVHASIGHLFALLRLCRLKNFFDVKIHLITDGRDSPPQSALLLFDKLEKRICLENVGQVVSIAGRYWAMDRDNHWQRTKKYFQIISREKGKVYQTVREAIASNYRQRITDEFIEPCHIVGNNFAEIINPADGLIFFNFRQDRARQISRLITKRLPWVKFVSFVPYQMTENKNIKTCFEMPPIKNYLSQVLSQNGKSQLKIAETEKFSHITYFFNGGNLKPEKNEKRILIDSFPVPTFDMYPEMRAQEISKEAIAGIKKGYDLVALNFANADMVGHTGKMTAIISAVETIDIQLKKIFETSQKNGYNLIITADHGNAEQVVNPQTGEPNTEHTCSKVPFIAVLTNDKELKIKEVDRPGLKDIAPTILSLMGITKPEEMTGESLV
ncbi:MAG: 2,3-bisphosphoglycerate-independent phosphoglycerate mutase [Candidatus Berkelbacteria bacterium Licking1014_7]|uniref:2,3-bisphosphoglycerate-independent phosphoglycerate mutase n=1 Tax=Candidatus Berkelbacteria bacterium Licking1014_7 TaxID=2017147 RepID=A0A554LHT9_9BACT|nr:MAG: 2,3-bisphosphoglycerate-independent phosphoglycerate mutase [Candidatus Berkelbacteria bacterium Licking1014_7]